MYNDRTSSSSYHRSSPSGTISDWRNIKFSNLNQHHSSSAEKLNSSLNRGKDGIFRPKSIFSIATEIDFESSRSRKLPKYSTSLLTGTDAIRSNPRLAHLHHNREPSLTRSFDSSRYPSSSSTARSTDFHSNFNDNLSYHGNINRSGLRSGTTTFTSPSSSSSANTYNNHNHSYNSSNYSNNNSRTSSSSSAYVPGSYKFTQTYYAPKYRDRPLLSNLNLKFGTNSSAGSSKYTNGTSYPTSTSNSLTRSNGYGGSGGSGSKGGSTSSTHKGSTSSTTSSHNNSVSSNDAAGSIVSSHSRPALERNKFLIKFREHEKPPLQQWERRRSSISWDIPPEISVQLKQHEKHQPESIKEADLELDSTTMVKDYDHDVDDQNNNNKHSSLIKNEDHCSTITRWSGSLNLNEDEHQPKPTQEHQPPEPEMLKENLLIENHFGWPEIHESRSVQCQHHDSLTPLQSNDIIVKPVAVVKKKKSKQPPLEKDQNIKKDKDKEKNKSRNLQKTASAVAVAVKKEETCDQSTPTITTTTDEDTKIAKPSPKRLVKTKSLKLPSTAAETTKIIPKPVIKTTTVIHIPYHDQIIELNVPDLSPKPLLVPPMVTIEKPKEDEDNRAKPVENDPNAKKLLKPLKKSATSTLQISNLEPDSVIKKPKKPKSTGKPSSGLVAENLIPTATKEAKDLPQGSGPLMKSEIKSEPTSDSQPSPEMMNKTEIEKKVLKKEPKLKSPKLAPLSIPKQEEVKEVCDTTTTPKISDKSPKLKSPEIKVFKSPGEDKTTESSVSISSKTNVIDTSAHTTNSDLVSPKPIADKSPKSPKKPKKSKFSFNNVETTSSPAKESVEQQSGNDKTIKQPMLSNQVTTSGLPPKSPPEMVSPKTPKSPPAVVKTNKISAKEKEPPTTDTNTTAKTKRPSPKTSVEPSKPTSEPTTPTPNSACSPVPSDPALTNDVRAQSTGNSEKIDNLNMDKSNEKIKMKKKKKDKEDDVEANKQQQETSSTNDEKTSTLSPSSPPPSLTSPKKKKIPKIKTSSKTVDELSPTVIQNADLDSKTSSAKSRITTKDEQNQGSGTRIEPPPSVESELSIEDSNSEATRLVKISPQTLDPFQRKHPHQKKIRFREYGIDDFQFLTVLGRGSFGKVLLAELINHGCHFAVKCLKKRTVIEDDDVESIMIERKVLAYGTSHPFICKLFCTFQTESHLFFVMELCSGGDLMFHVQKEGKFPEPKTRFYASEILCALWFLHKRSIIYRDLKLDNVMVANDGHIRLVDFGMCVGKMYREEFLPSNFCGTPEYMAPEIIKGVKYNHSVDYWALGVVIYEMCVGTSPFHGTDEDELLWNVCNTEVHYPKFLSEQVKNLCVLLMKKDPTERLGLPTSPHGDIVSQPWFHGVQWDLVEKCKIKPPFIPQLAHDADVSYFDQYFTKETPCITPCDKQLNESDQLLFQGFNYTNHRMTD